MCVVNDYIFVCQVVATFQRMRHEQRTMASKAAELEMEINEHRLVVNIPPQAFGFSINYFHI